MPGFRIKYKQGMRDYFSFEGGQARYLEQCKE